MHLQSIGNPTGTRIVKSVSQDDRAFRRRVDGGRFPVADFDHRAHIRLAYVHAVEAGREDALERMKASILGLLAQAGVDPSTKYHETVTRAWLAVVIQAVEADNDVRCADDFIERHPELLHTDRIERHYSPARLYGEQARVRFLAPDREPLIALRWTIDACPEASPD